MGSVFTKKHRTAQSIMIDKDIKEKWNFHWTLNSQKPWTFSAILILRWIFTMKQTLKLFLKEVSYAHQSCIYLIKTTVKKVLLWTIITNKIVYNLNCNLFLEWQSRFFSSHYFSLCRNHSNMLILVLLNVFEETITHYARILWWIEGTAF